MPYMFPVVIAKGLTFGYGPKVFAVEGVDLTLEPGTIHAIVGQSGSGKSTLADLFLGKRAASSGTIHYQGKLTSARELASTDTIRHIGRSRNLDHGKMVAECLGLEHIPTHFGIRDTKALKARAKIFLDMYGLSGIEPSAPICVLSAGQQRLIESAATISKATTLLVLDDPTAALTDSERTILYNHVSQIVHAGAAAIYLTSDPEEALQVGDQISVLREGRLISTHDPNGVFVNQLVGEMWGRPDFEPAPRRRRSYGPEIVLRVEGLLVEHCVLGVNMNLSLRFGEVLGLLGLRGAGQSEVVRAIGGELERTDGEIFVRASPTSTKISSQPQALSSGLGLVPDPIGPVHFPLEASSAPRFGARMAGLNSSNPQKPAIDYCLSHNCSILLFDNPTRGLNIANRLDMYQALPKLADEGYAMILASENPAELVRLCDRIAVMANGRIIRTVDFKDFSVEKLEGLLRFGK